MSKHDLALREKRSRNLGYANRFKQKRCPGCGHRSSKRGRCRLCGGPLNTKGE